MMGVGAKRAIGLYRSCAPRQLLVGSGHCGNVRRIRPFLRVRKSIRSTKGQFTPRFRDLAGPAMALLRIGVPIS